MFFYVYPTIYAEDSPANMDINNADLRGAAEHQTDTQAPGTTGSPVLLPGAFCINPLSWTTEETPANKLLNLGTVFFNDTTSQIEREIPHYAGAWVDPETGALVTTVPEELDVGSFPPGVYHRYDYSLWYRNLEANVKARCEKYLEQIENR